MSFGFNKEDISFLADFVDYCSSFPPSEIEAHVIRAYEEGNISFTTCDEVRAVTTQEEIRTFLKPSDTCSFTIDSQGVFIDFISEILNAREVRLETSYEIRNGSTSGLSSESVDFGKVICAIPVDLAAATSFDSLGSFKAPCTVDVCLELREVIAEGASFGSFFALSLPFLFIFADKIKNR